MPRKGLAADARLPLLGTVIAMPDPAAPTTNFSPSLLIAVTGAPGASKTSTLAQLAAARLARGQHTEGVLSLAGKRREQSRGAEEYWLRFIGTDQELPWALRDDSVTPPYSFEPDTARKLQAWAERIATMTSVPLLILDEFGRFELHGRGLMPVWPLIIRARPQVVVIAVREGLVGQIEALLGQKFDLVVPAGAPDALTRLLQACEDYGEWTRLGLYGGAAGAVEVTVGSILHSAKIPFSGLLLSSTQAAMMVYAGTGLSQPGRVVWVPFVSSGLKALSPAGSRLRPMIAITMQGLLFGGAVQVLGWNFLGLALGGALVGSWAALQGLALQFLLLGTDLVKAYDAVVVWVAQHWHIAAPSLPWLAGAWALLHALASCALTLTAWRLRRPPAVLQRIIDLENARSPAPGAAAAGPAATPRPRWREFVRWQFWLPLLVVAGILLATGSTWEAIGWLALRFVAVTVVLMALLSVLQPARWAERLRRLGWWGPALALGGAIDRRTAAKK